MDRLIDVAAWIDGHAASGSSGAVQQKPGGREGAGDIDLFLKAFSQDGEAPELPERLVRAAVACYPRESAVDIVLSYFRGALTVIRASADLVLAGPGPAATALRNGRSRGLPFLRMSKTFDRAVLAVIIEGGGDAGCTLTVQATDAVTRAALAPSRVELLSGQRELASVPLVGGRAQLEEVRTGRYELVLRSNDAALGKMTIDIVS